MCHPRSFSACDGWCSWQCDCHHICSHYVVSPKPGLHQSITDIPVNVIFRKNKRMEHLLICQKTSGPSNYFSSEEKSDLNQHKCVNNILVPNTDRSIWQVCWPRAFIDAGAADPQVCLATSYRVCSHPASGLSSHDFHIILCPAYCDLIDSSINDISM